MHNAVSDRLEHFSHLSVSALFYFYLHNRAVFADFNNVSLCLSCAHTVDNNTVFKLGKRKPVGNAVHISVINLFNIVFRVRESVCKIAVVGEN